MPKYVVTLLRLELKEVVVEAEDARAAFGEAEDEAGEGWKAFDFVRTGEGDGLTDEQRAFLREERVRQGW